MRGWKTNLPGATDNKRLTRRTRRTEADDLRGARQLKMQFFDFFTFFVLLGNIGSNYLFPESFSDFIQQYFKSWCKSFVNWYAMRFMQREFMVYKLNIYVPTASNVNFLSFQSFLGFFNVVCHAHSWFWSISLLLKNLNIIFFNSSRIAKILIKFDFWAQIYMNSFSCLCPKPKVNGHLQVFNEHRERRENSSVLLIKDFVHWCSEKTYKIFHGHPNESNKF